MELQESVDLRNIPVIVSTHPEQWPHLLGNGPLYASAYDTGAELIARTKVKVGTNAINVPISSTVQNTCVQPIFKTKNNALPLVVGKLGTSSTGSYILPKNFVYRFDWKFANAIPNNVTTLSSSILELAAGLGSIISTVADNVLRFSGTREHPMYLRCLGGSSSRRISR